MTTYFFGATKKIVFSTNPIFHDQKVFLQKKIGREK